MIPKISGGMVEGHCYRVTPDGDIKFESRDVSNRFFSRTETAHVIVPYELAPVVNDWMKDLWRLEANGEPKLFELRIVYWMKLWLVITVNFPSLLSLMLLAEDYGYELSHKEFVQLAHDGRQELFPFSGPTFRTFRAPELKFEQ